MQGKHRGGLRQALNRVTREGAVFKVIPADQVSPIITNLEAVSNQWLANKSAHEKGVPCKLADVIKRSRAFL
jgi:phosphatidylglycerol lysyltransferase